MEIEL